MNLNSQLVNDNSFFHFVKQSSEKCPPSQQGLISLMFKACEVFFANIKPNRKCFQKVDSNFIPLKFAWLLQQSSTDIAGNYSTE
jgi:hypothetical protein